MTREEAAAIVHAAPPTVRMEFRLVKEGFVALKAAPCPLYAFSQCLVYDVRPYNCRLFACMRPDVKAEPFEISGANMMDRVKTSRIAARMAELFERKAKRWARKHGWGG